VNVETPVSATDDTELPDRRTRRLRRQHQRGRFRRALASRPFRWGVFGVLVAALVFVGIGLTERVVYSGAILPGVEIEGVEVAGLDEADAGEAVAAFAETVETEPIPVTAGDAELALDPAAIGVEVDDVAAVREARLVGRSGNPVEQTVGSILRRFRSETVPLEITWGDAALDYTVDVWAAEADTPPVDGDLTFDGATVTEVPPVDGSVIDRDAARELLRDAIRSPERGTVTLPMITSTAPVTSAEVARAAEEARALLAEPVTVTTPATSFTIEPEILGRTLTTRVEGDALLLGIDPLALYAALGPGVVFVETTPVEASFEVHPDATVSVIPSQVGRSIDLTQVGDAILAGQRVVTASFTEKQPEHDTAWAEALNITERIGTFTTQHPCCASRVTNIHRAADILQNQIIEPGETFSLNDTLGPRTVERGFVEAGAIAEGNKFVEDVGGGVSQIATTLYNTVFFSGMEDVSHTPHSLYISRYPMGREATVNYPNLDLKWRNSSGSGVLIRTAYTDTSITISFYGNSEGRVVTSEEPTVTARYPAGSETKLTPFLPKGTTETEDAYDGFSVVYARTITQPGSEPVRQEWTWRYDTLDAITYVGVGG